LSSPDWQGAAGSCGGSVAPGCSDRTKHTSGYHLKGHVHVRRLSLPHSPCLLAPPAYAALGPLHPAFHVSIDAIAAGALLIKPVDTYHEVMNRTLRHSELPRFQAIPEEIETTPDSADKGLVRVFLQPQKPFCCT